MPVVKPSVPLPRSRKGLQPHGWFRRADVAKSAPPALGNPASARPSGTPGLLFVIVATLAGVGIARVHAQSRVLELGGEISQLTDEQIRLLELKRRLEAERAYLRHPDQVREVATRRLGMVPVTPDRIQHIDLQGEPES